MNQPLTADQHPSDTIDMARILDALHGPQWRLDQARRKEDYAVWCDEQARKTGWYNTYGPRASAARAEAARLRADVSRLMSSPRIPAGRS